MKELYDVRSKAVHDGRHDDRQWGWTMSEHLLMAAHVFPRFTKLLLEAEGHYQISDDDQASCLAVDPLLAATQWVADDELQEVKSWQDVISRRSSTSHSRRP
jgi:hypothetical protein